MSKGDTRSPRLYREKISEAVADYILSLLFEGKICSGDRIDRDQIADTLGVSRAPVQEALVRLERDGVVEMPFHRGAIVARFDANTVRDDFESYGLLVGLATSRVAANPDSEVIERLQAMRDELVATDNTELFRRLVREFGLKVYEVGASPRLQAALRSSITYLRDRPSTEFFITQQHAMPALRNIVSAILQSIRDGDPVRANQAAIELTKFHCELVVSELIECGALAPIGVNERSTQGTDREG